MAVFHLTGFLVLLGLELDVVYWNPPANVGCLVLTGPLRGGVNDYLVFMLRVGEDGNSSGFPEYLGVFRGI
jgi:hypothetical protein